MSDYLFLANRTAVFFVVSIIIPTFVVMKQTASRLLNVGGRLISLSRPQVMGILNCTPDSFYAGSRQQTEQEIASRANLIVEEGGLIIDVGAYSTRPGAERVSEEEEMRRLRFALSLVRREQPDAVISVDTFRPDVAKMAVEEYGAGIINDVSGGNPNGAFGSTVSPSADMITADYPPMFRMVAQLQVPYVLMSSAATIHDMILGFARQVQQMRDLGQKDIILDPGFGFGKTIAQNYELLKQLQQLQMMQLPVLVGLSRKSMIWR
jgi:dihydropteroate synthase